MCVTSASMVKSVHVATFTITQKRVMRGCMTVRCIAAAGTKRVKQFLINVKMSYTVNLIKRSSIVYHIKHQKTLRAINRAKYKQAQSLAKRAKRLNCKLTISVVFVSKNSIVI